MKHKRPFSVLLGGGGLLVLVFALTLTACDLFNKNTGNNSSGNGKTPVADDFNISNNMTQTAGEVTEITITPKEGKSDGAIEIFYNGSQTLPRTAGTYDVTFDVAATDDWNAATGLSAGTLTVNPANYSTDYFSENFDPSKCSFFDKFNGASLDTSKWAYQNGDGRNYGVGGGWGNSENQGYDPSGVIVGNGILRLELTNQPNSGRKYTSGKIVTANAIPADDPGTPKGVKFAQTYGRFEARIRLSKALPGAWPAWWMMPVASAYGGWPRSGEIDIMEMAGVKPNNASAAIHFQGPGGDNGHRQTGTEHKFETDVANNITQWHIYSVVWKPNELKFCVDGKVFRTITGDNYWYQGGNFYPNVNAPFDKDFFLILNLACDGSFNSARIDPAQLPLSLEVDWVRCYTTGNDPWGTPQALPENRIVGNNWG